MTEWADSQLPRGVYYHGPTSQDNISPLVNLLKDANALKYSTYILPFQNVYTNKTFPNLQL